MVLNTDFKQKSFALLVEIVLIKSWQQLKRQRKNHLHLPFKDLGEADIVVCPRYDGTIEAEYGKNVEEFA